MTASHPPLKPPSLAAGTSVVLALLDGVLVDQVPVPLALPPIGFGVPPDGTSVHGLCFSVHDEVVAAILAPVDPELVAVQRPVRVRGELVALEVVVAVDLELHGEVAAGPLELPLRARAV
eukprot:CAMPEP_0179239162 /NCGR_PEP_ID=MMETSP0797-20121207/15319_1 /TAXON_ID=47934 /ORGANISM="Dinophysis acuminata, Strain DAEP01" /LENGTH=119 /DNA_ID=CAMNT_0020946477 /DNA_START=93 /DNA_END=450 /DNA_ORIENTATION=-